MSKPKTQPVSESFSGDTQQETQGKHQGTEPLSGSKKVKNRQHSRRNQAEGS